MDDEKTIAERLKTEGELKSGANWFFFIAGLSLINSVLLFTGSDLNFIIGLGITQIIDVIGYYIGSIGQIIAFIVDIFIAGVFVLFGLLSRKGYMWAFIIGMFLYASDGLLFLLVQDWLSIGFHVFALYYIYGGLKASRRIATLAK